MNRSLGVLSVIVIMTLALSAGGAIAADDDTESRFLDDRWSILIGGYVTDFATDASVGSGNVLGTVIQVEDDLGVDNGPKTFRVDGLFRINEKQSIGFGYWGVKRGGIATIDEQIEWDGNVFDVGATLDSKFDTAWYRVDWRYSLLKTDRGEAGFAVGISAYNFNLGIDGEATIDDGEGGSETLQVSADTSVLAPVPTVGMYMTYGFMPNLLLRLEANLLRFVVGDIEGNLNDTSVRLDWYFSRHVGIGGGFNTTSIEYNDRGENPIAVGYRQSGFLGYVTLVF